MSDDLIYLQATVQAVTGLTPPVLGDWRRRGLLEGIGVSATEGGAARYAYSLQDVVALWIGTDLIKRGLDRLTAFTEGRRDALAVVMILQGKPAPYRFRVRITHETDGESLPVDDLRDITAHGHPVLTAIDLVALAATAPDALRELVRAA